MIKRTRRSVSDSAQTVCIEALEGRTLLSGSLLGHGVHSLAQGHSMSTYTIAYRHGAQVLGSVVSVDTTANTITVSTMGRHHVATQTTYSVDPAATVTADGNAVTLDQLAAGARVKLRLSASDPTTVTAIAAIGQEAEGTVTAVDTTANTITVAGRHGSSPVTYNISSTTAITVNGAAGTLAGITVGAKVELKLSALDPTTALSVEARTANPGRHRGGEDHHHPALGSVVSVDPTANTITVATMSRHGVAAQATYTVDPAATITADGNAITLSQLTAGVKVRLQVSPTSPTTVTAITAISPEVEGSVTAVDTTANTLTVAGENGTTTTYSISSSTVITVNDVASTLAALATGTHVEIKLSALDPTVVLSVQAESGGGQD